MLHMIFRLQCLAKSDDSVSSRKIGFEIAYGYFILTYMMYTQVCIYIYTCNYITTEILKLICPEFYFKIQNGNGLWTQTLRR